MSGQLGELVISLQADMAKFRSDMGKANKTANDTMTRMAGDVNRSTNAMQNSLKAFSGTVAASFSVAAVVGFTRETINAALAAEKLQMQFKASAGSAAGSARELAYIRGLSDTLGLSFQSTATAYGKFIASTRNTAIEGEAARKVFEGVSEAATALGLSADESSGIFLALSQMMSKGKVSAEELTGQLGERLPGALKLAADSLGLTTAELMKQMQEGKIMSADLLPKLAAELHKTYGTAAVEASKQGQAGLNRFKNEIFETSAAIGKSLMPALNSAASGMAELLKQMRQGDWGFNPGNFLEPFNGNTPDYNKASRAEMFRLPKAGEAMGLREREQRIKDRLAAEAAAKNTPDPKIARDEAARKSAQDRINASRAAAEKAAAGSAERERAATAARTKRESEAKTAQIKKTQELEAAQRALNAGLREQNLLLEAANKDWDLAGLGSGLLDNPLSLAAPKAPQYSLTGAAETMGYGGNSTSLAVTAKEAENKELLSLQEQFEQDMFEVKADAAASALGLAKQMAGDNKGMLMTVMVAEKALAIARIMQHTEVAAAASIAAYAAIPGGVAAGAAQAAAIRAMSYVSIGMVAASGLMEGMQIAGARASGGPVRAGETYLVGEKGPELMTAGANGYVTPNNKLGGGGVTLVQHNDFRGADPATEQRMTAQIKANGEKVKADILNSMNRGGTFAMASGRR